MVNAILGYTFNRIDFASLAHREGTTFDNQINRIALNVPEILLSNFIDYYPIITPEEALELLLEGFYLSTWHYTDWPGDEYARNAHVELVYRNFVFDEIFMPYYLFSIDMSSIDTFAFMRQELQDLGIHEYGWWWVPAVRQEFLVDPLGRNPLSRW